MVVAACGCGVVEGAGFELVIEDFVIPHVEEVLPLVADFGLFSGIVVFLLFIQSERVKSTVNGFK